MIFFLLTAFLARTPNLQKIQFAWHTMTSAEYISQVKATRNLKKFDLVHMIQVLAQASQFLEALCVTVDSMLLKILTLTQTIAVVCCSVCTGPEWIHHEHTSTYCVHDTVFDFLFPLVTSSHTDDLLCGRPCRYNQLLSRPPEG